MATTKSAVATVTPVFTFIWQQPSLQWQQSHQCLHLYSNNHVCSGNSHTSVYIYMATTKSSVEINIQSGNNHTSFYIYMATTKSAVATVTPVFTLYGNNQVCSGNSHTSVYIYMATTKSAVAAVTPVFTFTWQQPSLQWQQSHQCLHLYGNNQVCSGSHTSVYIYMATTKSSVAINIDSGNSYTSVCIYMATIKSAVETVTPVFTFTWQQPSLQ